MGRRGGAAAGRGEVANRSKDPFADSALPVVLESDLAPIDRLQVHLAFGDAELAKLRRLCEDRGLDGDVVLEMLELEQSLSGMGKRRGIRPRLRELIAELAADGSVA